MRTLRKKYALMSLCQKNNLQIICNLSFIKIVDSRQSRSFVTASGRNGLTGS